MLDGSPNRNPDEREADAASSRRDREVLRHILERQARTIPDSIFIQFEDGESWTYADAWREALATAAALSALGLGKGDVLLLWLPNGRDFLRLWFGTNLLGAIVAAPNLAYRGGLLAHLVSLVGARIAVVHTSLMNRLHDLDLAGIETVIEVDGVSGVDLDATVARASILDGAKAAANLPVVEPWDTQFVMFTSGTTGPSKGAIVPHAQMHALAAAQFGSHMTADDRYLVNLPLFHVGGLMPVMGALMTGGSIALIKEFRTEDFWDVARRWNATACTMMGAAAAFIEGLPPRHDDADNPVRWISMLPLVRDPRAFGRRFGARVFTGYGMSELSIPIMSSFDPSSSESCGRLRDGFEARIVDQHDEMVPDGVIGELVLRADRPWTVSPGYWRDPAATAAAWRNGWFHTGDGFRRDPDGHYYFVDRIKDAIRRRGENISSYEVELEALAHPDVREAAAIAVPSPHGEDDVMLVIVRRPESDLGAVQLFEHLRPRMAHFMLPQYIRFVDVLPKTPSLRVQKHLLRAEGVTPDSWDRTSQGIRVTRERL